jgi:uncharacterized membrane protein YfcA
VLEATIDILTILLSGLILFVAYFIRGISGFGSGLVAIPLLAHLLPLQFVVPWILLLDFTASLALGGRSQDRQAIRWREIGWLIPTTLVGILIGAALLVNLPKPPLLMGLGIFVGSFGLRSLFFVQSDKRVSRWWSLPTGLTGGVVSAMFGTGGPPYVIYLSRRIQQKRQLRATFSGLFTLDGGFRVIIFAASGLFNQETLLLACLAGLPVLVSGLYVGHRVHLGLSNANMTRIIGLLLIASGLSLLFKGLAS